MKLKWLQHTTAPGLGAERGQRRAQLPRRTQMGNDCLLPRCIACTCGAGGPSRWALPGARCCWTVHRHRHLSPRPSPLPQPGAAGGPRGTLRPDLTGRDRGSCKTPVCLCNKHWCLQILQQYSVPLLAEEGRLTCTKGPRLAPAAVKHPRAYPQVDMTLKQSAEDLRT